MSHGGDGLRRELGLLDATMINVGTMVASAIFIVPATIAASMQATGPALAVWVVAGVISLFGALCVAELGAAMPGAGGQYVYLGAAFHPAVGFLYGWSAFLVINTATIAAIAVGFASYMGFFVPLTPAATKAIAVASIVALTVINCRGLETSAMLQNVFTLLKMGALLALPVLGVATGAASAANLAPLWPAAGETAWVVALGPALVAALWAFDGWIEVTYVGSEVKDPGRVLPLSIILSTVIVILLYLLANVAYLAVLSPGVAGGSALVASDAAQVILGAGGAAFIAGAILLSTLGANHGMVFTSARIPYAMAREGMFFAWAGRLHPKTQSPNTVLVVQGAVAVLMTLTGSYEQLLTYVVFVGFFFYALSALAVIVLRRRRPDLPRPYRAWGYPLTPVLFIAFAMYLVADTIVQAPREAAVGAGIVLLGLPAFWRWRRSAATGSA